jgi:hypothetical protein
MITRCAYSAIHRGSQIRISHHQTHDAVVSDAAAKVLTQAHFPAGHRVVCDCMSDGSAVKAEDCKNLNVYDADGKKIANFSIADFQATQSDDGTITILRRAAAPKKLTETQDHARRLHELNLEHERFYKRGPA